MKEERSISKTRISIITPSYNRADMIEGAIESVLAQNYEAFEHIIVDAGSTDDTAQILRQYSHLKVICEADRGMYDALNKGVNIATGDIIGFLNTDDLYGENVFSAVVRKFDDPTIMAVTGHAIVFYGLADGTIKIINKYDPDEMSLIESSMKAGAFFNAWFFRKSTFDQIGTFDSDYKIVGDRDFMIRFALSNLRNVSIPQLVYKYRMHPDSLTFDKTNEKRTWSADEHLTMTSVFLKQENLSALARKLLIRLRTLETVDMAARSIWVGNYGKFIHYLKEGFKYDAVWPLAFIRYLISRGTVWLLAK